MLKNSRDVRDFMERKRLAGFATVGLKNEPHVVPVFFTYEDGKVYVQTSRESVKVRNLLKNNKVAVAVYSGEEAVVLRGEGRILDSDEEFARRTQDHIDKYRLKLNENGRDSMGIPLFDKELRCVIEVIPTRRIFW